MWLAEQCQLYYSATYCMYSYICDGVVWCKTAGSGVISANFRYAICYALLCVCVCVCVCVRACVCVVDVKELKELQLPVPR